MMASYKSTENLIASDDGICTVTKVQPVKPIRKLVPTIDSIESIPASETDRSTNHQIRQVQPVSSNKQETLQKHVLADSKKNTHDNISVHQLKTAAVVHRSPELTKCDVAKTAPIPMPRKKFVAENRSSTNSEEQTQNSTSLFSHSRQDTIIENVNDIIDSYAVLDKPVVRPRSRKNTNVELSQTLQQPQPRTKSYVMDFVEVSSSSELEVPSKNNFTSAGYPQSTKNPPYLENKPSSSKENQLILITEELSSSFSDTSSNSDAGLETSLHTFNEKIKSMNAEVHPPLKPRRKLNSGVLSVTPQQHFFDKLIGIYIHETSPMMFDYALTSPMVRVSICDVQSGDLLLKSDPNRSAVQNMEPEALTFIQPLLSRASSFKDSTFIECVWEELLLINEDIQNVQTGNEVIFFEIVSMMQIGPKDFMNLAITDGWHHICWAFLRPGDGRTYSHVDQRSQLQLFVYQTNGFRKRQKFNILEQWRMKRQKYPATLDVTLKGVKPINDAETSMKRRPMHVLEEDTALEYIQSGRDSANSVQNIVQFSNASHADVQDETYSYLLGRGRRLPGQICKVPNKVHSKLHQSHTNGSLVAKFCPNGRRLAIATVPDNRGQLHDITVVRVPGFRTETILQGHTNMVYSLEWGSCVEDYSCLLSVSSDRTAIVWRIDHRLNSVSLKIFPHPCFVYTGVLLNETKPPDDKLHVATGGRDGLLRVWRSSSNDLTDLLQELPGHENYITSIVRCKKSKNLYSSDWNGTVIEWNLLKNKMLEKSRIVKSLHRNIRHLHLQRTEGTLFVTFSPSAVTSLNIRSGIQLHTFDISSFGDQKLCCTLSPCGSLLFTSSGDTIQGWNILTGERTTSYTIPLHEVTDQRNYISSIDYHAHTFMLSVSIYGVTVDAGVYILDHIDDQTPRLQSALIEPEPQPIVVQRPPPISKYPQQQDLSLIIQRIDDIFRLPQNRTDDLKSAVSTIQSANTFVIAAKKDNNETIEMIDMRKTPVSRPDSLTRSATFTVSKNDGNNRTFSISAALDRRQSETFDLIDVPLGNDSDSTTVSVTF